MDFNAHAPDAAQRVVEGFGLSQEQSAAVVRMVLTLGENDPALLVTFRPAGQLQTALRVQDPIAQTQITNGRPCPPGRSNAAALQNFKNWLRGLVADFENVTEEDAGEHAIAFGYMDMQEFGAVQQEVSFTFSPGNIWGGALLAQNISIGSVIGVHGAGHGSATLLRVPSIAFRDR